MDPITIALLGSAAFGAAAWAVKKWRPGWAGRLAQFERYASIAFYAVEAVARLLGWSSAEKLAAYLERLEGLCRGAGLPWSKRERAHAEQLARVFAEGAKDGAAGAAAELAMRAACAKLDAAADAALRKVAEWDETLARSRAELAAKTPPSMR